jgi:AAA+ superfamily predicted ATPase
MRESARIPGTPAREIMVAFQVAVVERMRAMVAFRGIERAGGDLGPLRDEVQQWSVAIREIVAQHAIPFIALCDALGLGQRERDALVLVAAPHLDGTFRSTIAAYHGSSTRRHVDAALVLDLLCVTRPEALDARMTYQEGGILHQAGLIESIPISTSHTASLLEHELLPTPRLLKLFEGEIGLDRRFKGLACVIEADPEGHVGVMSKSRVEELASRLLAAREAIGTSRGLSIMLAGGQGVGKVRLARALAASCGIPRLIVVDAVLLPVEPIRLARVLEGLCDEAEMLGARVLLRGVEMLADSPRAAATVLAIARRLPHEIWSTSNLDPRIENAPELGALSSLVVSISFPDLDQRHQSWSSELHRNSIRIDDARARSLAQDYPIPRSAIADVVGILASSGRPLEDLPRLAETRLGGQLGRFAKRGQSRTRLEQLVLPAPTREQLHELRDAVRFRGAVFDKWKLAERHAVGRGIVALFNGPPGTGKTMSANAISNELGLPLYRIDTSSIADRYVGETEKNLVRLFDEAAASRAALLFDEADSLFGKRVEAQDSNDRHANMQINVLLNLIEDYDGFVVLTTNMKGALDTAFLRRIIFKIGFDLPDFDERLSLWSYHLSPEIPRSPDVDLEALADRFDRISGGDIKNAVLRAVLQTRAQAPVTQADLVKAMANELRANGSVISEGVGRSRPTSVV